MPTPFTLAVMEATDPQFSHCQVTITPHQAVAWASDRNDLDQLPDDIEALLVYTGKTQQDTLVVCERLRSHTRTASMPIIFVAPSYDITHTFVVQRAGNAELLTEPFTLDELQDCLEEFTTETS